MSIQCDGSIGKDPNSSTNQVLTTPTIVSPVISGGSISGVTISDNMTSITDPSINAAVTTAIVSAYNGVLITLTTTGNAQTLQAPTLAAVKKFTVMNNDTSTNSITVNGIVIGIGESQMFIFDGTAWSPVTAESSVGLEG